MKTAKYVLVTTLTLLSILLSTINAVYADIIIEINGNGGDTNNQVTISNSSTTTINQSNDVTVNTTIDQTSSSGGNTVSGSSGDTSITTGDVTTDTSVTNSLNNSVVETGCCPSDLSIVVSSNGEGSTNTVNMGLNNDFNVSIHQSATVDNTVSINGISGNNTATGNGGSVDITTGAVNGYALIKNGINNTWVSVKTGLPDVTVNLFGNGANSVNNVYLDLTNEFNLWKTENAYVNNILNANLVSGNNIASGNIGPVVINTGAVAFGASIVNDPINTNVIKIEECKEDQIKPPPGNGGPPGNEPPPGPGPEDDDDDDDDSTPGPVTAVGGTSTGSSSGSVLGALVSILPKTGISASTAHQWMLAVMYLLMFLLGLYVRLRAGRSPDRRVAYAYAH